MTKPNPSQLLVIGYSSESTIAHFTNHLRDQAIRFEILDLEAIQPGCPLSFHCIGTSMIITIDGQTRRLDDFDAFYCRLYYRQTADHHLNQVFLRMVDALNASLQRSDRVVVNKPGCGASNYSKLAHLMDLRACGFSIPPACVLGNGHEAQTVLADLSKWVSKGCSSYRTRVESLTLGMYADLDLLAYCPSQFQTKITGDNVRVHMVGTTAIGLRIVTPNIDYRYDTADNRYEEIAVPPAIWQSCWHFCRQEGLLFAGFDFIIDATGTWYVLEANPMPGFEFYDRKIGHKIAAALASLLTKPAALNPVSLPVDGPFIGSQRRKKFF